MNEVEIIIDGQTADYENSETLPLTLSKKTDSFFDIPGSRGMELDNELEKISLPATKNNHTIYEQIGLSNPMPGGEALSKETKINVAGLPVFSGSSVMDSISVNYSPELFTLDLIGDSLVIWQELEGVSLRDLDLGVQTWNASFVVDSWTENYDSGWKGLFAPIVFGKNSGVLYPGSWHEKDFRFSVYFRSIVDAIFNDLLGYSIVSTFFNTDFFKECVYVFSVGEHVQYQDLDQSTRVVAYRDAGSGGGIFPIEFNNTYVNTFGEWDLLDTFTAAINADFEFDFYGTGENWDTLEIKKNGSTVFSTSPTSTLGSTDIYDILETITLVIGDEIEFFASGSGTTLNSVEIKVSSPQLPWEGGDIVISTCLHDEPVKNFLSAISHMFNLAWRVNNTTKQVFVEPRLPYVLYESGTPVTYQGFYERPSNTSNLEQLSAVRYNMKTGCPFGKSLKIGYKKNDNDPLYDSYKNGNTEPLVPLFGIKKDFAVGEGKTSEILNPLFCNLFVSQAEGFDVSGGHIGAPTILPENYDLVEDMPTVDAGTTKYKGQPTCGLVYRGKMTAYYDDTDQFEDMPLVVQHVLFQEFGDPDTFNTLSFADTVMIDPITEDEFTNPGLISTFYSQWLQMANPAIEIDFQQPVSLDKFSAETFQELKKVQLNNENQLCILAEIGEMNPVTLSPARYHLIKWSEATSEDAGTITHNDNTLRPAPKPNS